MEISAKVLREVEFSGSLRGYNTDEVDEFLEQVALAVDGLQSEARAAMERSEQGDRGRAERTGIEDEESIRRTLVLAQRTADLAIREAQEEAAQILDRSRAEAETLVTDARESAERITSDAERRLRDEVNRLSRLRDELRDETSMLVSLLAAERERLTESLGTALRYVEKSLTPSADVATLPGQDAGREGSLDGTSPDDSFGAAGSPDGTIGAEAAAEGDDDEDVDELEAAIAEDAAAAAPSRSSDEDAGSGADPTHERPNLTALPPLDDPLHDTASWPVSASRQAEWPA